MPVTNEIRVITPLLDTPEDFSETFADRAIAAGGDAEDEEEDGKLVHYVNGLTAQQAADIVSDLLRDLRPKISVGVKTVRVTIPGSKANWLKPGGSTGSSEDAYGRLITKLAKQVSADPEWAAWWATTPYTRLFFLISKGNESRFRIDPEGKDLVVNASFPDSSDVLRAVVNEQLKAVLTQVGEWLGSEPPAWRDH